MKQIKKIIAMLLSFTLAAGLCACANNGDGSSVSDTSKSSVKSEPTSDFQSGNSENTDNPEKEYIEQTLNLANNADQEWTYSANADA